MSISGLDHFNIRARDMDAMRDFFVDVIGLTVGDRPNFPFPERLTTHGIDHTARDLPGGAAQQIFCAGPEGVTIEVVIPTE